jgi:hypothetical protein
VEANRRAGGALIPVLLLLVLLAGAGAWNYNRNLTRERAEEKPRPYKAYSDDDLAQLEEGYRIELAGFNKRFGSQRSRRIEVRNRGLIADQIDEFERVQQAARRSRGFTGEAAALQAQLDRIVEERRTRTELISGFQVHLKRLVGV